MQGFLISEFLFIPVLFLYLTSRKKLRRIEVLLFGLCCIGAIGNAAPYILALISPTTFNIPRFEAFSIPFFIFFILISISGRLGINKLKSIGIACIVVFAIISISLIPSYVFIISGSPAANETSMRYNDTFFAANIWFDQNGTALGGERTQQVFDGLGSKEVRYSYNYYSVNSNISQQFQWIVIEEDDYSILQSMPITSTIPNRLSENVSEYFSVVCNEYYSNTRVSILRV
jgi:hypothetical protein